MNKKDAQTITNDVLIADALLRVKTLENVLIAKGLFTREEYNKEMSSVTKIIAKSILEKANVSGNIDDLLDAIQGKEEPKN